MRFSPNARPTFETAVWLIPVAAAINRVDQWELPFDGFDCNVFLINP